MTEVTDFSSLDTSLDSQELSIDEVESMATREVQVSQSWRKRYSRAKALASRLARMTAVSSTLGLSQPRAIRGLKEEY